MFQVSRSDRPAGEKISPNNDVFVTFQVDFNTVKKLSQRLMRQKGGAQVCPWHKKRNCVFTDVPQPFASLKAGCRTTRGFHPRLRVPIKIGIHSANGVPTCREEARQTFTKPCLPKVESCRLGSRFVLPARR